MWLFGSAALGDFDARRSDLDVQAVTRAQLGLAERTAVVADLSHEALACPARGLELVIYARDDLDRGDGPTYQLNLNTGPRMVRRVDYAPDGTEWFWFTIDVAIGRDHGRALAGPPAGDVFPRVPAELVRTALRAALAWLARHDRDGTGTVLAACRAWAWASDARWRSKVDAAHWAAGRLDDPGPVHKALALRDGPRAPGLTVAERDAVLHGALRALR